MTPDRFEKFNDMNAVINAADFQTIEYMAYLRHYGFPSPILDWTASLYVASYFAMIHAKPATTPGHTSETPRVGVFAYISSITGNRQGGNNNPSITPIGAHGRHQLRHFAQKSRYTAATTNRAREPWKFVKHERVFDENSGIDPDEQDVLVHFTLPASERQKVLEVLDEYGLNAYTLFDTDETLLEVLSRRYGYRD